MQSSREITINAPPDEVWRVLTDISSWPRWQSGVSRAVIQGNVATGAVFHWTAGGLAIRSEISDVDTGTRLSWKGQTLGSTASHDWYLSDGPTGTNVLTDETLTGWLPGVLSWFSPRFLDRALDKVLRELKAEAERAAG